jgi:hypothetical protein
VEGTQEAKPSREERWDILSRRQKRETFCPAALTFSLLYSIVIVPAFQPLPLGRASEPFSHPDWLFEVKWMDFARSSV